MNFNLQSFFDVLYMRVSWLEANFFWVIISAGIYLCILFFVGVILFIYAQRYLDWGKKLKKDGKAWIYNFVSTILFFVAVYIFGNVFAQ